MKKIISWLNDSAYIPPLSPACTMCAKGSKMVLLATGLCSTKCYYCPLSFEKGGKDVIYADEWKLNDEHDTKKLIKEAKYIDANGAGITGGDPLLVWQRVKNYITILKNHFGDKFHIHLYTSGLKNSECIHELVTAGLDEIRFHPPPNTWKHMNKNPIANTIKNTTDTNIDVALEIPVLPDKKNDILTLIYWANEHNIKWINLNELEFSERNHEHLYNHHYHLKNEISAAVTHSQTTACDILQTIQQNQDTSIGVHYCSVSFKDGVQLTNRLHRRAKNIAKPYEVITDEATLLKGTITKPKTTLKHIYNYLQQHYNIPSKFLYIDIEKKRIEIGLWILEQIASELNAQGFICAMVEEYPTADRLEVEKTPLPL